ncbi:peptidyl-prolyl cis-trans isomerase [Candidatus Uhrbacteria bacterium]|nr:peptidyl-prolyl cis-trans isomerase [Candidatus Uhrbacteria bacterium]
MGLTVSKEEIDGEFDRMVGEDPDAGVEDQIADLYGWTSEKFKEKVIGPYLLEQKLGYALIGERVDSVREKIEDGGDFGALASEYSDDTASAANGGDLGWFGRGEMVPEFESAAFSMEPGEVSPPIKTQFGYHIIRVEEVRNGQDGEVSEVHASHILVMNYGADDFLRERMEQANIKRFVALDGDSE